LLSPSWDAFRAGRLQLIFSAWGLEKMDLPLVLFRHGVAHGSSSREIKSSFLSLKYVLITIFFRKRESFFSGTSGGDAGGKKRSRKILFHGRRSGK
jgi:hypothetical protein